MAAPPPPPPYHKTYAGRGESHEIYNFGRHFIDYHYYMLSLFDPSPRVDKKISKEIMQLYYVTYMATSYQKKPCNGSHEIYNLSIPFLIFCNTTFVCFIYVQW